MVSSSCFSSVKNWVRRATYSTFQERVHHPLDQVDFAQEALRDAKLAQARKPVTLACLHDIISQLLEPGDAVLEVGGVPCEGLGIGILVQAAGRNAAQAQRTRVSRKVREHCHRRVGAHHCVHDNQRLDYDGAVGVLQPVGQRPKHVLEAAIPARRTRQDGVHVLGLRKKLLGLRRAFDQLVIAALAEPRTATSLLDGP